jgi:hypothetical protein
LGEVGLFVEQLVPEWARNGCFAASVSVRIAITSKYLICQNFFPK